MAEPVVIGSATLYLGDCMDALRTLPNVSVDSVVTDPPAGIGFMGKDWDHHKGGRDQWVAWMTDVAAECLRVLKPGGHALVWAIPRTSHWTATALEDAGFEIRDRIAHVFGTGFPKSLRVKDGLGTALKPAMEDWWLCRKPLTGTVAQNVMEHGTGALNIDASRIMTDDSLNGVAYSGGSKRAEDATSYATGVTAGEFRQPSGRFPANLIHDGSDEVVELFPASTSKGHTPNARGKGNISTSGHAGQADVPEQWHDTGSAARFFYCAKASKADRDDGLEEMAAVHRANGNKWTDQDYRVARGERPPSAESGPRKNVHPTVKATELMRYLCRLITPPGGTILDPFMGSGSTGKAAMLEGFRFIGIEREPEYFVIAQARIENAQFPHEQQRTSSGLPTAPARRRHDPVHRLDIPAPARADAQDRKSAARFAQGQRQRTTSSARSMICTREGRWVAPSAFTNPNPTCRRGSA